MSEANIDDFAFLSIDIAYDVLQIGCPKFEDLELLEETEGRWGDVIRRGSLRKTKLKARGDWTGDYIAKYYQYGLHEPKMFLKRVDAMKDWSALQLTDVEVQLYDLTPVEASNRVFRHATESVSLSFTHSCSDRRISEVLDILSSRPITKMNILYPRDLEFQQSESFFRILANPNLRHLRVGGLLFNENNANEALMSFIKKPNFVSLTINAKNETLHHAVLEHWLQLTSFATHMQRVTFCFFEPPYDNIIKKFKFREIAQIDDFKGANSNYPQGSFAHFLDHPHDETKRIEGLNGDRNFMEFCLTSKEASVSSEWSEYEDFELRKYVHRTKRYHLLEDKKVKSVVCSRW